MSNPTPSFHSKLNHKDDNIIEFRRDRRLNEAYEGGGNDDDWLSELPIGTTFLTQTKNYTKTLKEFTVKNQQDNATLLRENRREGLLDLSNWEWYIPKEFCKEYYLRIVL